MTQPSSPSSTPSPSPRTAPLSQPYYGAPIGEAARRFWAKYSTFSGRASRSEYWWWALVEAVIWVLLALIAHWGGAGVQDSSGAMTGLNALGVLISIVILLFALATIVPNLALTFRRLHDANLSGFFILLGLIPGVGGLILFILSLLPSNRLGSRFDAAS
jgi:uncharacterized membrane protein YhaH (DUF805 family)